MFVYKRVYFSHFLAVLSCFCSVCKACLAQVCEWNRNGTQPSLTLPTVVSLTQKVSCLCWQGHKHVACLNIRGINWQLGVKSSYWFVLFVCVRAWLCFPCNICCVTKKNRYGVIDSRYGCKTATTKALWESECGKAKGGRESESPLSSPDDVGGGD